tara:strand:- start:1073 stop:1711 length:639 start_codon:yes stop_codon:yes gene_type:complete
MFGKNVLIVCALEQETQGQLDGWNVLYTGVGKINATYKLTELFGTYHSKPAIRRDYDVVINYGTAGSRELPVGELVDCTKFIQRDMDVTGLGFMRGETPFENDIPSELDFSNKPFNPDYGREHHINTIKKHYTCGTGDNFVDNIEDEIEYVDVFDMEAYALAKVCYHYVIPFISFKYITDGADEQAHEDWEKNLADGIKEFKERILKEFGNE